MDKFEEVHLSSLPRHPNVVYSHSFFAIKVDGKKNEFRLKCSLFPHENRDRDKDVLRTDFSTAQFAAIRLMLSLATLHGFALAALGIKGAYFQSACLNRDIYMRPLLSFCKSR